MGLLRNAAIALGATMALAVAPGVAGAAKMFVPNYSSQTISVFDTATNTVTSTITDSTGGGPWLAAVTPNGQKAYIVDYDKDTLIPITVATGAVGTPIPFPGSYPEQLAISPDGQTAYVVQYTPASVDPINLATGVAGTPIDLPSGAEPYGIAITPNGQTAYVTDYGNNSLVPINLATGTVETGITIDSPYFAAVTPNGQTVYVQTANGTVVPVNTATNTAGTAIPLSGTSDPFGIAISPNGGMAYVTDYNNDSVYPINLSTNTAGSQISVGAGPEFPTLTPDGRTLYTSNYNDDTVTPISTASNIAATSVSVGDGPGQLGIVPDQGPVAAFSDKPGSSGHSTSFNGSGSSDSDGTVARYDWSFGDGSTLANGGATPSHTYAKPGKYTVTLTVTDNAGCSSAFVFTGQTAYCNGTAAARTTRTVTVAAARLKVAVSPHGTRAGKNTCFTFTVSSSGKRVSKAKVTLAHHTAHTSSKGKAKLCLALAKGSYTAHASKKGFKSATTRVAVKAAKATKPAFTG